MNQESQALAGVYDQPGVRPGCVTSYVILLVFGVLLSIYLGIMYLAFPSDADAETYGLYHNNGEANWGTLTDFTDSEAENPLGISFDTLGVIMFASSAANVVMAVGLWRMRKWGLWLYFALIGISILENVVSLFFLAAEVTIVNAAGTFIGLVVSGAIVYWFYQNRWRFV